MSHQDSSKPKTEPTAEQKTVLLNYREKRGMVSTKQHELIAACHKDTGLPVSYIRRWIGNTNAKAKGTRKGGSHYRPSCTPRRSSAYNLFCSETQVPPSVRAKGLTAQNLFWSKEWNQLPQAERVQYYERAKNLKKEVPTKHLEGNNLSSRKNYLLRCFTKAANDLSMAGIEVASYVIEDGEREVFMGTQYGISFLKSRTVQSNRICAEFTSYVAHKKYLQGAKTGGATEATEVVHPVHPEQPQEKSTQHEFPTEHAATGDSDAVSQETPNVQKYASKVDKSSSVSTSQKPHDATSSGSGEAANKSQGPSQPATPRDLLMAMSRRRPADEENIPYEQIVEEAYQQMMNDRARCAGSCAPSKAKKKKSEADEMVGTRINHQWRVQSVDGTKALKWFKGTVVGRSGKNYQIQYDDEGKVYLIPVSTFQKSIKAGTMLFL